MASPDNSWMPAQGRHPVSVGSSLGRALKARKGVTTTSKRSNLPDRDFYSFRYNFRPNSVDTSKPGTIDVKRGKDSTSVVVEHPSSVPGEAHVFNGAEHPAKQWDCVLIYDEETGAFTLEKLDSYMVLTYERKTTVSVRPSPSPPIAPPAQRTAKQAADALEEELNRGLLEEDADGDPDEDFEEIVPAKAKVAYRKEEEEEEEEGEVLPTPVLAPAPAPPPRAPPAKAKPRIPKPGKPKADAPPAKAKPPPAPTPASVPAPPPASAKGKGKAKREHAAASDVDEEVLEFGQSARQAKRPRKTSDPVQGLALPGASAAGAFTGLAPYAPPYLPPAPAPTAVTASSDDDEEWDEVPAVPSVPAPAAPREMVIDLARDEEEEAEEEEIDVNAFEAELNQHLEESEDDFLAAAVSPEPEAPPPAGDISADDEEYSSSEESDED